MKFQYELQRLRKQAGMSQEELGERLGVSRQTISKWENGTSYPDMLNLMTISGFFSVSVDSLVTDAPAPPQPADEAQVQKNGQGTARFHYEYKSKRTVFGMPLVHVNIGSGLYKAKGFVAVGMISKGIISIGVVSLGLVSFGRRRARLICHGGHFPRPVCNGRRCSGHCGNCRNGRRRVCPWRGCRGRVERGRRCSWHAYRRWRMVQRTGCNRRTAKRHRNHPGAGPWGHYQRNEGASL